MSENRGYTQLFPELTNLTNEGRLAWEEGPSQTYQEFRTVLPSRRAVQLTVIAGNSEMHVLQVAVRDRDGDTEDVIRVGDQAGVLYESLRTLYEAAAKAVDSERSRVLRELFAEVEQIKSGAS